MDSSSPDMVGRVIDGRYRLIRRLAQGGMADVYLAKESARKCRVAIKILRSLSPESQRRFAVEAEILSNIKSAGIVHALDFGKTSDDPNGRSYMALEYLEGASLSERLAQGPLPWRDVAEYGAQVADALHALHVAGIVHRDVKPDNIMLTQGGDRSVAKLIDLGLASVGKPFQEAQDEHFTPDLRHPTQLGHPIGTPAYLPPEAGQCAAEPRLDVFALGVTLYQLCTRQLPQPDRRSIRDVCPESDAPEDLSRLLLAALEPDPLERLPSADHLRRGLAAIFAAHPRMSSPLHLFAGSYDRLEVLGVGASAVVYRASDRVLSRQVALKVLKGGEPKKDDALKIVAEPSEDDVIRFRRAAKVLSAVRHPSIPQIHHTGIHEGQLFAVTELCSGSPATNFVRPDKHLRPDEVIAVGLELTGALAAVHAVGVVYRDLHPGNVLVARGDPIRAWIFDFDQAQLSPEFYAALTGRWDTPPEKRTEPKREKPLQNMDYASPEVRAGAAFSVASDVYALGLLLYRMLTGKRPFPAGGGEPTPPRKVCPACPRGLERLLLSMLSPAPDRRPALGTVQMTLEDEQAELAADREAEDETAVVHRPPAVKSEPAIQQGPDVRGLAVAEPVAASIVADAATVRAVQVGAQLGVLVPPRRSRSVVRLSALAITALVSLMVGRATVRPPPEQVEDVPTSLLPHRQAIDMDPAITREQGASTSVLADADPDQASTPESPAVSPMIEELDHADPPRTSRGSTLAAQNGTRDSRRRGSAHLPSPRGPVTSDEAQLVAARESVLVALGACANIPGTIIAEMDIEGGHGSVAMFNRHPPSGVVSWHACARTILEGLEYPASTVAGRVRVRLKLQ